MNDVSIATSRQEDYISDSWGMFSPEGDELVGHMLNRVVLSIAEQCQQTPKVSLPTLKKHARKLLLGKISGISQKGHAEITDTTVRENICYVLRERTGIELHHLELS